MTQPTDISQLPNPYDFANPVNDEALFVGRATELGEIRYYLDQARMSTRPINIAVLGPRASGKTSVLNMVEKEADQRGLCVVRIDLDETDAESQMAFFFKIIDAIFTTIVRRGAFGGISGRTYQQYLDTIYAYKIPEDKLFCPLLFPLQYATAMGSSNGSVPVSDAAIKADLDAIQHEIGAAIVICIDEGNVLANCRTHLEKLRNVFMNMPRFMIVVAGTPDLFPVIDDVFSPIVRQFNKVILAPYRLQDETESLIRKPLTKIGLEPEELFGFETYRDVAEVHDISGGRPYEIQLICHCLFKRVQQARSPRMQLTVDVLDEVLRQLETTQNVATRPLIPTVRGLTSRHLEAIALLCACSPNASIDQLWFIEYALWGESRWTHDELVELSRELTTLGVIRVDHVGRIAFCGDDFDRIYCKYFARRQRINLSINDQEISSYLRTSLRIFVHNAFVHGSKDDFTHRERSRRARAASIDLHGAERDELLSLVHLLASDPEGRTEDPYDSQSHLAEMVTFLNVEFASQGLISLLEVEASLPSSPVIREWIAPDSDSDDESAISAAQLLDLFGPVLGRIETLGGSAALRPLDLPVVPLVALRAWLLKSRNQAIRSKFSDVFAGRAYSEHIESKDSPRALEFARFAHDLHPNEHTANNVGYLSLICGQPDIAVAILEEALPAHPHPSHSPPALRAYNLGVAYAQLARYPEAIEALKRSLVSDPADRSVGCLIVPRLVDSRLVFSEVRGVEADLGKLPLEALAAIEGLSASIAGP